MVVGIITLAFLHLAGKTPKGLHFKHGAVVAALSAAGDGVSVEQTRKLCNRGRFKNTELEAKRATSVNRKDWTGFWISFQEQTPDPKVTCNTLIRGQGCYLVLLYTRGGRFIYGHPLQNFVFMTELIHHAFVTKGIRFGFLAVDYNRDSAGGNLDLAHVLPLKIRDEYPKLGLPIGTITSLPYMFFSRPNDHFTIRLYYPTGLPAVRAYSRYDPATLASSYYTPLDAESLADLPPMLVFVGRLEQFRPLNRAHCQHADQCSVKVVLAEARAHCWFLTPAISTSQDRVHVIEECTRFLAKISKKE
ncbi:hypothetical protein CPC16_011576 [Podila verticillata]|nr:hypothetical protein BGZ59_006491 [Podila verticillata]KAF9394360.1 hypothetical protein CPC16_011576 [Podila verticillata]KFH66378.1 hypothetical protein MVEG_08476 [Podila verticillata NRRL 6337]